jgi:hypothetical protein
LPHSLPNAQGNTQPSTDEQKAAANFAPSFYRIRPSRIEVWVRRRDLTFFSSRSYRETKAMQWGEWVAYHFYLRESLSLLQKRPQYAQSAARAQAGEIKRGPKPPPHCI